MCGKIDCYLKAFSGLRTNKNKNRWPAATTFRAPHKPFLLLSVLDLIAKKKITREFIEISPELADEYAGYWSAVMRDKTAPDLAISFYSLDREPFWQLVPQPGTTPGTETTGSLTQLKNQYLGAKIDNELFKLCLMETLRRKLRDTLIANYFDPETQELLKGIKSR